MGPPVEQVRSPPVGEKIKRPRSPQHRAREGRGLTDESAGDIHRRQVLVHSVRFDVLVEEQRRVASEAEPPQPIGVAAVGDRGGHLEKRQMPDDRAAPPPVQPEQRHLVDGREGDRRDQLQVGAVRWVETQRPHRSPE